MMADAWGGRGVPTPAGGPKPSSPMAAAGLRYHETTEAHHTADDSRRLRA